MIDHVYCVCNPQCLYIIKCAENEKKKKGLELLMECGKVSLCGPLTIMATLWS